MWPWDPFANYSPVLWVNNIILNFIPTIWIVRWWSSRPVAICNWRHGGRMRWKCCRLLNVIDKFLVRRRCRWRRLWNAIITAVQSGVLKQEVHAAHAVVAVITDETLTAAVKLAMSVEQRPFAGRVGALVTSPHGRTWRTTSHGGTGDGDDGGRRRCYRGRIVAVQYCRWRGLLCKEWRRWDWRWNAVE